MIENGQFVACMPSFCNNFPYIFPSDFSAYSNQISFPYENLPYCQYYPVWTPAVDPVYQIEADSSFQKPQDQEVLEQQSTASKGCDGMKKPRRTQAPRFRPTKNNESNISNQAFSFVTSENKSKNILVGFFKNKKKAELFYNYSKTMTCKRKKYMSKATLLKLCTLSDNLDEIPNFSKLKTSNILSLKEFESGVCFLILYFLKHKSTTSILTSHKIVAPLKKDHIVKVREIINYIEQNLSRMKAKLSRAAQKLEVKLQY